MCVYMTTAKAGVDAEKKEVERVSVWDCCKRGCWHKYIGEGDACDENFVGAERARMCMRCSVVRKIYLL